MGAVDYIFKPVVPAVLRSKVPVFVELSRQQRRLADQEQQLRNVSTRASWKRRTCRRCCSRERASATSSGTAMDAIILFDEVGHHQV